MNSLSIKASSPGQFHRLGDSVALCCDFLWLWQVENQPCQLKYSSFVLRLNFVTNTRL